MELQRFGDLRRRHCLRQILISIIIIIIIIINIIMHEEHRRLELDASQGGNYETNKTCLLANMRSTAAWSSTLASNLFISSFTCPIRSRSVLRGTIPTIHMYIYNNTKYMYISTYIQCKTKLEEKEIGPGQSLQRPQQKNKKKNKKTPTTKLEEKEIGPGKSLQHPLNPNP